MDKRTVLSKIICVSGYSIEEVVQITGIQISRLKGWKAKPDLNPEIIRKIADQLKFNLDDLHEYDSKNYKAKYYALLEKIDDMENNRETKSRQK